MSFVPDVKGMRAKDATFALESVGVKVTIVGKGKGETIHHKYPLI